MRLRLIFSFALIMLVSVTSVVLIARQQTANEVGRFMYGGGMAGLADLETSLESYYAQHGSWQGVESVFQAWLPAGAGMGNSAGQANHMGAGVMRQRFRLADTRGVLFFDSSGSSTGDVLSQQERKQAIRLKNGLFTSGYLLAEGGMGFNQSDQSHLVDRLSNAAVAAGFIAGGVSLLLALLLSSRLLRPVNALTQAAERMAAGDLSQRVPVTGNDELSQLGNAFNRMADSLDTANTSRKAMTADIAHELRNPLAVQRATLEAMQDGVFPINGETLAPVLQQNLLLTRLVDDLRTLALADSGQLQLELQETDLTRLTQNSLEHFQPQAAAASIQLHYHDRSPKPLIAFVDPLRVEQILNNLLSNALRYTPAGGFIEMQLAVQPTQDQAVISVHDSGPGIPLESLPYVFDRFYRADRSRSRAEGGSGLGLSIARQLAQTQGGSLEASNHPEGGAIFTLVLPTHKP